MAESNNNNNNEEIEVLNNFIVGSVAVKRVTVDDLNKLTLTGKYYTIDEDSIQNKPEAGLYNNYITVMDVPYNNIVQTFTNLVSGKAYVRTRLGESTWSAWEPMCIKNETEQALEETNDRIDELNEFLEDGLVISTYRLSTISSFDYDKSWAGPEHYQVNFKTWGEDDFNRENINVPAGCHLEISFEFYLERKGEYGSFKISIGSEDIFYQNFLSPKKFWAYTKRVPLSLVENNKSFILTWNNGSSSGGVRATEVTTYETIYVVKDN